VKILGILGVAFLIGCKINASFIAAWNFSEPRIFIPA
jgi:hypothetical protein